MYINIKKTYTKGINENKKPLCLKLKFFYSVFGFEVINQPNKSHNPKLKM